MTLKHWMSNLVLVMALLHNSPASALPLLDLAGYQDESGAISILNGGNTADPYFALQALLLAHDNGLDVSASATKFANWLTPLQKPDGTFDRFCKMPNKTWVSCKAADADDSLLALWMLLLQTMPQKLNANPTWLKSHAVAKKALDQLYQPSRGVYMVSPVYLHGWLMDNLEVWSLKASAPRAQQKEADDLAAAINKTFWQSANNQFLVSTQLEQQSEKPQFYPDHVAQIFPLLVDFKLLPQTPRLYYQSWMRKHRADWLKQGEKDYPWGLLAVLALRQSDMRGASCWIRENTAMRHSNRWAVTDEVAFQILASRKVQAVAPAVSCQ